MRRKISDYAFSKQEIKILRIVASGSHSLSKIRMHVAIKPNLLSHYLKKLQNKGILEICTQNFPSGNGVSGYRKSAYFQDSNHALVLKDLLTKEEHVKWENILSGIGIEILFQILNNEAAPFENISSASAWRYKRNLTATGILEYEGENLHFNPRFSLLASFLEEYQRFIIRRLVGSISELAIILWQKDFECLIQVPKTVQVNQAGFMITATSCFADYGISLLSDYNTYFYSNRKKQLQIEDIILHTLLIDKNSTRYITYCLLLLEKNYKVINQEYLIKQATRLGLIEQINTMLQFLKTKGAYTGMHLPTWSEFTDKMQDYGIGNGETDSWDVVHSAETT